MKLRNLILALTFGLLWSCDTKTESVQEGGVEGIVERTPEEIANYKEYAPKFEFASIDGQNVSIDNLKGKVLYIDIWATWCRPCLQQLPAMKELEEKYRDTDVQFVSISVDSERDKGKWEKMVHGQEMKGVQLFAGSSQEFSRDYKITTIPRFVIIGKDGELLNFDAPRPMDYETGQVNQELIALLDNLRDN